MTAIYSDPFTDPIDAVEDDSYVEEATLSVGRNASLTLATESLVVLGKQRLPCILQRALTLL